MQSKISTLKSVYQSYSTEISCYDHDQVKIKTKLNSS